METEGGQPVETAAPEGTQQEQNGAQPEVDPVLERFDEMRDRMDRLETAVTPPEAPYDPYEEYGSDPSAVESPAGAEVQTPEAQAEQAALERLDSYLQGKIADAVGPVQQEHQQYIRDQQAAELEQRYPELKTEIAEQVVQEALEHGAAIGLSREAALHPRQIEQAYLAGKARERAEQEAPADGQSGGVELEGAGGASPQAAEEDDIAMRMLKAGGNDRSWLFS